MPCNSYSASRDLGSAESDSAPLSVLLGFSSVALTLKDPPARGSRRKSPRHTRIKLLAYSNTGLSMSADQVERRNTGVRKVTALLSCDFVRLCDKATGPTGKKAALSHWAAVEKLLQVNSRQEQKETSRLLYERGLSQQGEGFPGKRSYPTRIRPLQHSLASVHS